MSNGEEDQLVAKCICIHCIGELFLKDEVKRLGKRKKCSYCNRIAKAYTLEIMAGRLDDALQQFYVRTPNEPDSWAYYRQKELGEIWDRDGYPIVDVIEEAAAIPRIAAEDIQELLNDKYSDFESDQIGIETEYSSESNYSLKNHDDKYWRRQWEAFSRSVRKDSRIFNDAAKKILESIFEGISELTTLGRRSVIVDGGPGTDVQEIYRARTFTSIHALREALSSPDQQLGPPSTKYATSGRMNSRGISVFYGASEPSVAISEVRPPVGSKVVVAAFEVIRPIKLLDLEMLTAITASGSIFDKSELGRRERHAFLRTLTRLLTLPVMPGEEELEYIPTQAVADFLAQMGAPHIDGIRFSSVQSDAKGSNYVLFHKSSFVEPLPKAKDSQLEVRLGYYDDEVYIHYTINEKKKVLAEVPPKLEQNLPFDVASYATQQVPAHYTLRIRKNSIKVHEVKAASFSTDDNDVLWIETDDNNKLSEQSTFGSR